MSSRPSSPCSSVVIAAFDAASTLGETLASILPRLGPDDEVLVCDDGSQDATATVAASTGDPRVRVLTAPHSGAPSQPRNRGIEAARGDIVFFVDADDVVLADKFATTRAALDAHPDAALAFTNFRKVDERGDVLVERALDIYELMERLGPGSVHRIDAHTALRHLARENFIGTSGVAVRRDVLRAVGGFDPSLTNSEDRDLWMRIARHHAFVYVDEVLHAYRVHSAGISNRLHERTAHPRVRVLLAHAEHALDDEHSRDLRASAADILDHLAFECFALGDMRASRRAALRAWRIEPRAHRLRRIALSCLSPRVVDRLRALRNGR